MLTDSTTQISVSRSYFINFWGPGAQEEHLLCVRRGWGQADCLMCWLDFLCSALMHKTHRNKATCVFVCVKRLFRSTASGWQHVFMCKTHLLLIWHPLNIHSAKYSFVCCFQDPHPINRYSLLKHPTVYTNNANTFVCKTRPNEWTWINRQTCTYAHVPP